MEEENEDETHIAIFNGKAIRRKLINDEWFFSVVDIVGVLTESEDPNDYWYRLKKREQESSDIELSTFCRQLRLKSTDGKEYETDCANTEGIFRIIQSIPSKKAEPFKRWLAKVGYERVQEIENPELAQERMKQLYEAKGYSKDWIDKRLRGIAIRQELTDEWKKREITQEKEFAILTNEISKATFGKTVQEYKDFKNLKHENLRDHMTDWELILSMIGEKATTDITVARDSFGLEECKIPAKRGCEIAKNTREQIEKETGKNLISNKNYLDLEKRKKKVMK